MVSIPLLPVLNRPPHQRRRISRNILRHRRPAQARSRQQPHKKLQTSPFGSPVGRAAPALRLTTRFYPSLTAANGKIKKESGSTKNGAAAARGLTPSIRT
jgi:hypothetical protein